VDIQNVGNRTAEDTGGAILNNHIDVFRGFGLASMHGQPAMAESAIDTARAGPEPSTWATRADANRDRSRKI